MSELPRVIKLPKPVVVVFEGGFKDGERLRSASSDPSESEQAIGCYLMTSEGTVGKRFRTYSYAGLAEMAGLVEKTPEGPRLKREPIYDMNHVYELVERVEDDDSIFIRFRYAGKLGPAGTS